MLRRRRFLNLVRYNACFIIPLIALFTILLSACSDVNSADEEGTGQMSLYLSGNSESGKAVSLESDAQNRPTVGSLEEVNLDVVHVRVKHVPYPPEHADADEDKEGKWHEIDVEPFVVNLLELSHADTLIARTDLPAGRYSEIRLVLGSENHVVADGTVHDLKVPSGSASGYKIKFDEKLDRGDRLDLILAFDVIDSIHRTGNGQYMLRPVIHVSSWYLNR